jgi:phage repressor protein C with HTH and peptisase S24 domain
MLPTLLPGEVVTALRRWRQLRTGDIVVVRSPTDDRWMIKRCQLEGRSFVQLLGDNSEYSTDSRDFGPVATRDVRWVVLPASIARRTSGHDNVISPKPDSDPP